MQDVSRTYEWNAHLVDAVVEHIKHRHDDPALVSALADIVQSRARAYLSLINLRSDADNVCSDEMRRAVFLELLARAENVFSFSYTSPPLFDVSRDTLWALREVEQATEAPHVWIGFVSRLRFFMVKQSDAAFDALYAAAEKWPALKESCRDLFESPIGGEEGARARAAREAHAEQEESFRSEAAQRNLEQKLRVEAFLAGDLTHAEWIADNFKEPSGRESWLPLGTTHAQLEAAMVLAVTSGDLGVGHGPRALRWALSLAYEREQLDRVPATLWRDIAGSLSDEVPSEQDVAQRIGEKLWACAREALLTTLRGLPAPRIPYVMSRLERLFAKPWPRELLGALHELTCRVPPDHGVGILDKILAMDPVAGVPLARSIAEQDDAATRQHAQSLMVRFADRDTRLHLASTLFTQGSAEGRAVIELIAERCAYSGQLDLPLDELVSMAIWIRHEYPREPDVLLEGDRVSEQEYHVHRFLEKVLAFVFSSEDEVTLAQVKRLEAEFPKDEWLRHRAHDTHKRLSSSAWQPLPLPELFRLVRDRRLRIVRTVEDLFEMVGESLSGFQADLLGGKVDRLWNTKPVNPKDEETLSDELGRFLAQDLTMQRIIAVREVQVRPSPKGLGRKVDVYLSTFGSTAEPITVLIEVKRCVHKSWDDVEGELIARYFDHHHRHGWYVVGHYNDGCAVCSKLTLEEAKAHIQDRIAKIQGDYVVRGVVLDCRWETAASVEKAEKAAKGSHGSGKPCPS